MTSHEILNMIDNLKDRIKDKEYKDLVEKIAEMNKKEEKYVSLKILKITECKVFSGNPRDDDNSNTYLHQKKEYDYINMRFKLVDEDNPPWVKRGDLRFSSHQIEMSNEITTVDYKYIKSFLTKNGSLVLANTYHSSSSRKYEIDFDYEEENIFMDTTYIITGINKVFFQDDCEEQGIEPNWALYEEE